MNKNYIALLITLTSFTIAFSQSEDFTWLKNEPSVDISSFVGKWKVDIGRKSYALSLEKEILKDTVINGEKLVGGYDILVGYLCEMDQQKECLSDRIRMFRGVPFGNGISVSTINLDSKGIRYKGHIHFDDHNELVIEWNRIDDNFILPPNRNRLIFRAGDLIASEFYGKKCILKKLE